MSQINTGLLQSKLNEANTFLTQWESIKEKIVNIDSKHQAELNETNNLLQTALADFKTKVASPLLTIAVTGTTSSGKSSLINLLCGADIMPRMAGEMSAGLVTIHHILPSAQIKVVIHPTDNAKWQCGTWSDLADADIRALLTSCMDNYNECRQAQNPPAYPKIDVYYPIHYFLSPEISTANLPPATQFRLLDLPGLKNSTDELNKEVLKECKEALCLVTYDMAETNPEKRKTLVNEVLTQIKSMGGTLERMLFVLNRIDVYDKDADAERRKNEAEQTILAEIKSVLASRLPEYRHLLDNICFSRLSSLPALYALQLINFKTPIEATQSLEGHFGFLIPKEILNELPRAIEKWSAHDFQRVGTAVYANCYANNFFASLSKHIQINFAKLVLSPLLVELKTRISFNVGECLRLAEVKIQATEEACEKALFELEQQQKDLTNFFKQSLEQLESHFKTTGSLESQCKSLLACEPYNQLPTDTLAPCYLWADDISMETDNFLDLIWHILKRCNDIDLLSSEIRNIIADDINKLIAASYPFDGSSEYNLTDSDQKKDFDHKSQLLIQFVTNLSSCLNIYLSNRVIPQLFRRVQESLDKVLDCYINFVQLRINQVIPQWGLSLSHPTVVLAKNDEILFFSNFSIKMEIRYVRSAWALWLIKCPVVTLPPIKSLDVLFKKHFEKDRKRLEPSMSRQIAEHFEKNYQSLKEEQERVYEQFKAEYEKHQQQIQQKKEIDQEPWQALLPIIEQWQQAMQTMTDVHQL